MCHISSSSCGVKVTYPCIKISQYLVLSYGYATYTSIPLYSSSYELHYESVLVGMMDGGAFWARIQHLFPAPARDIMISK